MILPTAFQYKM